MDGFAFTEVGGSGKNCDIGVIKDDRLERVDSEVQDGGREDLCAQKRGGQAGAERPTSKYRIFLCPFCTDLHQVIVGSLP